MNVMTMRTRTIVGAKPFYSIDLPWCRHTCRSISRPMATTFSKMAMAKTVSNAYSFDTQTMGCIVPVAG